MGQKAPWRAFVMQKAAPRSLVGLSTTGSCMAENLPSVGSFPRLPQIIQISSKSHTIPLGFETLWPNEGELSYATVPTQSSSWTSREPKSPRARQGPKATSAQVSYMPTHCSKPCFPSKWLLSLGTIFATHLVPRTEIALPLSWHHHPAM